MCIARIVNFNCLNDLTLLYVTEEQLSNSYSNTIPICIRQVTMIGTILSCNCILMYFKWKVYLWKLYILYNLIWFSFVILQCICENHYQIGKRKYDFLQVLGVMNNAFVCFQILHFERNKVKVELLFLKYSF